MIYIITVDNVSYEIDAWTKNEYFAQEYLRLEENVHSKHIPGWKSEYHLTVERWEEKDMTRDQFPYTLDPTKELVVKKNLVGDSYLLTRGEYVKAVNSSMIQISKHENGSVHICSTNQISTVSTVLGIYSIFMKNGHLCEIIRSIRKRTWEIDPFTYESRFSNFLRRRKI